MKFQTLEIKNFLGIKSAKMDLSAPVNVILGNNAVGKSSVRDAIDFVFTGLCDSRGFRKKNQAPLMKCDKAGANEGMKVSLQCDSAEYQRTTTKGTGSPVDPVLMTILTNPVRIIDLDPAVRQKIFARVLGDDVSTKKFIDYFTKLELPETIIKAMVPILEMGGPDELQKWAVEQRRAADRKIKDIEAESDHAPPSVVDIPGSKAPIDLTKFTGEDIREKLQIRQEEHESLLRKIGAAEGLDVDERLAQKAAWETDLDKLVNAPLPALAASQKLHKRLEDDLRNLEEVDNKIRYQKSQKKINQDMLHELMDRDICSLCLRPINKELKEKMDKLIETNTDAIDVNLQVLAEQRTNLVAARDKTKSSFQEQQDLCDSRNKKIEQLQEQLQKVAADSHKVTEAAIARDDLDSVKDKLESITLMLQHLQAYTLWTNAHGGEYYEQIEQLDKVRSNYDTIDAELKANGALRRLLSESAAEAEFDKPLAKAWRMESLQINAEGEILYKERPLEAASKSERYRGAVLVSHLLADKLGLKVLVIDDLDELTLSLRKHLMLRLQDWTRDFESIVLLAAVDNRKDIKHPHLRWMKYWWVDRGTIVSM